MAEKGAEQSGAPMFGKQRVGDFLGQVIHIVGDEVGHLPIFSMAPAVVDHVQVRRICWQELHAYLRAIEIVEETRSFAMPAATIPNHRQ